MALLDKSLLEELECPVCTEYMSPPIRQCENTHAICNSCFERLDKCPICRQSKVPSRCHILEMVYTQINIPCAHQSNGCEIAAKGGNIKLHETTCFYSPACCPLRQQERCSWLGLYLDVEGHCRNEHPNKMFFRADALLDVPGFQYDFTPRKYLCVFYVYERVFRCYWDFNGLNNTMRFSVTSHGMPFPRNRFTYRIGFLYKDSLQVTMVLKGACEYVEDDEYYIVEKNFTVTSYKAVNEFCTSGGHLRYCVKIVDNSL